MADILWSLGGNWGAARKSSSSKDYEVVNERKNGNERDVKRSDIDWLSNSLSTSLSLGISGRLDRWLMVSAGGRYE